MIIVNSGKHHNRKPTISHMAKENDATVQACLEVKMMDTCLGKLLRIFLVL